MLCEFALRQGDSDKFTDGNPLVVRPLGVFWSSAEMIAWIDDGEAPASLAQLSENVRVEKKRSIEQKIALAKPGLTPRQLLEIRYGDQLPSFMPADVEKHLRDCRQMIADAQTWVSKWRVTGVDSNWGTEDLRKCGILVADMEYSDALDMVKKPILNADNPLKMADQCHRRRVRLQYERILSPDSVDKWRDPHLSHPVNREAAKNSPATLDHVEAVDLHAPRKIVSLP